MLTWARPAGYSAGCVVGKKVVYLEELRHRGPDPVCTLGPPFSCPSCQTWKPKQSRCAMQVLYGPQRVSLGCSC